MNRKITGKIRGKSVGFLNGLQPGFGVGTRRANSRAGGR